MSLTPRLDRLDENLIINGSMNFWQRGTGATQNTATAQYLSVDRFFVNRQTNVAGSGALNVTQSTDVPTYSEAGFLFPFSTRIRCNTTNTTPDPNFSTFNHRMEGTVFSKIRNGKARLTFWYKSNKLGTYHILLQNNAGDRHYVMPLTVASSLVWTKFDQVIDFGAAAGTFLTNTGIGLTMSIFFLATAEKLGSTTLNQWNNYVGGAFLPTSQVNFLDNTSNDFFIAGIQLKAIDNADQDTSRDFSIAGGDFIQEQALCYRYYWRPIFRTPLGPAFFTSAGAVTGQIRFPVEMRTTPTPITLSNGDIIFPRAGTSNASAGSSNFSETCATGTSINIPTVTGTSTAGFGTYLWINSNAGIEFSAEL